ncbi:MAG: hypothetical protein GX348_02145 [Veillonellaceae bacterium]|jgi:hypothetical protein|nr:hypothetical protein [Veillonellaceae bacterium]
MERKIIIALFLTLTILLSSQVAFAGIKVSNDDKPVFVSSHMMGGEVFQQPNGVSTLSGIATGFAGDRFPLNVRFKTLTTFVATARYESPESTIILTDYSGKKILTKCDFYMFLARPGALDTKIIDWNITFPEEGFYAFNIFVDGTLVGYYPFYVWTKGVVIK